MHELAARDHFKVLDFSASPICHLHKELNGFKGAINTHISRTTPMRNAKILQFLYDCNTNIVVTNLELHHLPKL